MYRIFISLLTIPILVIRGLTTTDEEEPIGIVSWDEEETPEKLGYKEQKEKEKNTYQTLMTNLEKKLFGDEFSTNGDEKPPWKTAKEQILILYFLHNVNHISINESDQTMRVNGRICSVWHDSNYFWESNKYDGVTGLSVARWLVWTPNWEVLNNVDGLSGIWSFKNHDVKLFVEPEKNRSTVISCPEFSFRVGCEVDASAFPHDSHVCRFPVTDVKNNENIDMSNTLSGEARTSYFYAITRRNDTKPNVADFTVDKVVSRILYFNDDTGEYVTKRNKRSQMVVGMNEVHFTRFAPFFFHTLVVPSIVFGLISAFAPLTPFLQASTLLLMNLVLLGVYMRDLFDELPRNFRNFPRIVIYWMVQLLLSAGQLLRVFLDERRRVEKKEKSTWRTLAEWRRLSLGKRFLNFDVFFICCSFLAMLILLP